MQKHLLVLGMVFCLLFCIAGSVTAKPVRDINPDGEVCWVLVVYYSFTGNTAKVAEALAARKGADLYRIETMEQYDENPRPQVKAQRETGQWPALQGPMPDLSPYDMIIIGMPVWMGDVPPPVVSYLQQADLKDNVIAYFYTVGPKPRDFVANFEAHAKGTIIISGQQFDNLEDAKALKTAVDDWLEELMQRVNPLIHLRYKNAN